jgi:ribosomal protein L11
MKVLMEETSKHLFNEEQEAELFVQELKKEVEENGAQVVDYKITIKETKDSEFVILTSKVRYLNLTDAKLQAGV